jgi:hypothetical protein
MTAARRLAAIMAADVVGYSRLMGEDEAGTARAVHEHREAAASLVRSFGVPGPVGAPSRRPAQRGAARRVKDRNPPALPGRMSPFAFVANNRSLQFSHSGADCPLRVYRIVLPCLRSVRRGRRSAAHKTRQAWLIRGRRGGERRGLKRENGQKQKNTPRGPRKPLKRLVSEKEIKGFPRKIEGLSKQFRGFSKGFRRNQRISKECRNAKTQPRLASSRRLASRVL